MGLKVIIYDKDWWHSSTGHEGFAKKNTTQNKKWPDTKKFFVQKTQNIYVFTKNINFYEGVFNRVCSCLTN